MSTAHSIIRFPCITEKNSNLREKENKYVFEVAKHAGKPAIKRAVEQLFGVRVINVNTMNVRGKRKRMGKYSGFRPDWKKAIIKIQSGETISKFSGV